MDEEVALGFAADVEEAVASVRELAASAQDLAATAKEAQDGVAGIAAPAAEAAAGVDEVAGAADKASGSLGLYVDAAGRARLANGQFATSAQAAAAGLGEVKAAAGEAGAATEGAAAKSGAAAESGLGKYKMALVGIGVGTALAVDQAAKFQDSTTHLVTDAGESAKQLGMVQQGILGVSAATGTSASSITDAMYHIESSGFHGASGLAILKTTAEGAKVGGADLDTTSKALVGTLTAYYGTSLTAGQATRDSTALMNELITTVGSGDMRMQDLASSMSAVTPVAAANHISFAQVGGALAVMTAQGMSARQASQNLAHAIRSLTSPTNVQSVEMKAMGLNANDVAKNLGKTGLAGTLDEMRDAVLRNTQGGNVMLDLLKGMSPAAQGLANQILAGTITTKNLTSAMKELNPEQYALVSRFKSTAVSVTGLQQTYTGAMSKMLGGATGLNVGLMLTGTHMKDLTAATRNIAAEGAKASGTVDNWSTIQGTFAFKMSQAKASIQDTGIALGSALLPSLTAILGPVAHFLALIASNKAAATAFAVVIGGILAGALGLKLAGALKDAKKGIEAAGDGVEWLVKKLFAAKAAQEAQTTATEAGAAVQEASAAEAEAQAVATEALTAAKEESVGATEAAAAAQGELDVAMDANPIGLIIIAVMALIGVILLLVTHWRDVVRWFDVGRHDVAAIFDGLRHDVSAAVDAVVNFVTSHWQLLLAILTGPVGLAVLFIRDHWNTIKQDAAKFVGDVISVVTRLPGEVLGFFERMASDVTGAERRMVSDVIADVKRWISDWISTVTSGLDSIAHLFEALPGRLLRFLESLPGDMQSVGRNIVTGLLHGIESMGSVLATGIESLIPSPIRSIVSSALGIFSPSTVFHGYGQNIVQGLINGVRSMQGQLAGAMGGFAGGVTSAGSAYAASAVAPAGGSTSVHVTVPVTATGTAADMLQSPQYQQALQAAVQEVTLRYAGLNPTNGLTPAWGRA